MECVFRELSPTGRGADFSLLRDGCGHKLKVYAGSEMKTVWQHLMQITTNSSSAHVYMQGRRNKFEADQSGWIIRHKAFHVRRLTTKL